MNPIKETAKVKLSQYISTVQSIPDRDGITSESLFQEYLATRKALVEYIRSTRTPENIERMKRIRLQKQIQSMNESLERLETFRSKWLDTLVILEAQNTTTLDKTYIDPVAAQEVLQERSSLANSSVEDFDSQIQSLCLGLQEDLDLHSNKVTPESIQVEDFGIASVDAPMHDETVQIKAQDLDENMEPLFPDNPPTVHTVSSSSSGASPSVIVIDDDEDMNTPATASQSLFNTPGPFTPGFSQVDTPGSISDVIMTNAPSTSTAAAPSQSKKDSTSTASVDPPEQKQTNAAEVPLFEDAEDAGLGSGFLDYF